jgi:hypothetical protein
MIIEAQKSLQEQNKIPAIIRKLFNSVLSKDEWAKHTSNSIKIAHKELFNACKSKYYFIALKLTYVSIFF